MFPMLEALPFLSLSPVSDTYWCYEKDLSCWKRSVQTTSLWEEKRLLKDGDSRESPKGLIYMVEL